MKGSTYKRCKCPAAYDAKGRRKNCRKDHGTWYYVADAGFGPDGKRKQVRKGGFRTADDAEKALAKLLGRINEGSYTHDEGQTLATWLGTWLDLKEKAGLRPTTLRSYRAHIDDYLLPQMGRVRLQDLRPSHVDALLSTLSDGKRKAATVRRVHATLRSALSTAVRRRLITFNAAKDVDLPTSQRPKVKPWEPVELGQFLDYAIADSEDGPRYGALFEVMAYTGLRRGEAVGLRWDDVDLARRTIVVRQQVVQESGRLKAKLPPAPCPYCEKGHRGVSFGRPKTASGENRAVPLDDRVVGALLAHQLRQQADRETWGTRSGGAYADHGLVFAREDGNPLRPDDVTRKFGDLVGAAGMRRIRLHDLRHGYASLMLAAGKPMVTVSKMLGHSTIVITADTYSHMLDGEGQATAEAAAALVPRAAPGDQRDHSVTTPAADSIAERAPETAEPPLTCENGGSEGDAVGRPCGTRTHNQRIKSTNSDMPTGDDR